MITRLARRLGVLVSAAGLLSFAPRAQEPADALTWHDAATLTIEGRGWDTATLGTPFVRLPTSAKAAVRDPVWQLSRDSAGILVRFVTDSPELWVRWTVTRERLAMPHMPATGASGVDLYVHDGPRGWRWAANGRPAGRTTTARLLHGLAKSRRSYLLYLPLYNGVTDVAIGTAPKARVDAPPARKRAPLVFYGTSITQGASASRPGMCHTAILGRRLDRQVVNLGFSGNGRLELAFADLLAEIDAAVYVLDCLPNLNGKQVAARTEPFVRRLRSKRPDTPIVLVEDRTYQDAHVKAGRRARNDANRKALAAAFAKLTATDATEPVTGLIYVSGADLLGDDGDATVDGSHPTDLGFARQADVFESVLAPILFR